MTSRDQVATALLDRLRLLEGVAVYDGEVPKNPPLVADDEAGRVGPYVVVYAGVGRPRTADESIAGGTGDLTDPFQLTCAAGYASDLRWLLDQVHPHIYLWSPDLPGVGRFRVPDGYDPGTSRRDDDKTPVRHWTPLQYQLDTTS